MNKPNEYKNPCDIEVATLFPALSDVKKRAFLRFLQCIDAGFSTTDAIKISNEILSDAGLAPVPADFGGMVK